MSAHQVSEPNWLLFHRSEVHGSPPTQFGELVWLREGQAYRTYRRWGRTNTWGESECTRVEAEALSEHVQTCTDEFIGGGLVLARTWRFDPDRIDRELLKAEIVEGTRLAYQHLTQGKRRPTGFALNTDSGAMTVVTVSNYDLLTSTDDEVVWCPDEWSCWDAGEFLDVAYRIILGQHRDDLTRFDFAAFRSLLFQVMVESLDVLVDEGTFGAGEAREHMVVTFHVSGEELNQPAIRRLNSPALVKRFDTFAATWSA